MSESSPDNQYSLLPPPGFTQHNFALKRVQLIDLLEKIIEKCTNESQFVEEQPKQIDLLFSIAQFTLLPTSTTLNDKRDFLNNVVTITQDLLTEENQINMSSDDSSSPPMEEKEVPLTIPLSDTPSNDDDDDDGGGLSLDDLANEYLQNEPSPVSLNDKPITPSESGEADLTLDDLSKNNLSSSTNILSKLLFAPILNETITKPPLESILFSNRLSSHDDADCIWKQESSSFGQMFCKKNTENQTIVTKQISTCLFDRSLYERLRRLISLLPKQCIRNSVQQLSIRPNGQFQRPPRPNIDPRRPQHRPTFHDNALQAYPMQHYPPHQYINPNYSNQPGNFVDQRHQNFPPQPFAQNLGGHQYQQRGPPQRFTQNPNDHQYQQRGPPQRFAQNPGDHQYQQRGPPRNNAYDGDNQYQQKGPAKNNSYGGGGGGGNQQQKKKQAASNPQNNQNQRGSKKGSGGE